VCFWFASSIKRTNAANSVASLSAQDLWCTSSNFDGALAGKFTGALVSSNSGAPGEVSVKLRGITLLMVTLNCILLMEFILIIVVLRLEV
jgi:hypothetical protein